MASGNTERVSEALIRSVEHDRRKTERLAVVPNASETGAVTIAVSREAGSGGADIARAAGQRLGWGVYDHELLEQMARDLNVRVKLLEGIDERHVSWLQEAVEAFCNVKAVREATYVRSLIETMLSLGARGNCVIVGRGAPFVLPAATTVRVRVTAPERERISNVSREQGVSPQEAARIIAHTDEQRNQIIRMHFLHDPTDPSYYDLVINSARFPMGECVRLILDAVQSRQPARALAIA